MGAVLYCAIHGSTPLQAPHQRGLQVFHIKRQDLRKEATTQAWCTSRAAGVQTSRAGLAASDNKSAGHRARCAPNRAAEKQACSEMAVGVHRALPVMQLCACAYS